jgi:hypothetical protein
VNQGKILALDGWYKDADKCKTYWKDHESESSGMNYYTRFYCYGGEYEVFGVTGSKRYWAFIIVLVNFICLVLMMLPTALSLSNIRCIRRKFQIKYSSFQAEVKNFTLRLNLYMDQDQIRPDDLLANYLWYHVGHYFIDQEPEKLDPHASYVDDIEQKHAIIQSKIFAITVAPNPDLIVIEEQLFALRKKIHDYSRQVICMTRLAREKFFENYYNFEIRSGEIKSQENSDFEIWYKTNFGILKDASKNDLV